MRTDCDCDAEPRRLCGRLVESHPVRTDVRSFSQACAPAARLRVIGEGFSQLVGGSAIWERPVAECRL